MNKTRREFIKRTGMVVAGSALLSRSNLFSNMADSHITGIQLYSVRENMGKDALGTLKQLSGYGYKYVEHANYVNRKFYNYSAQEFKKILDDLGMKMYSGHTVMRKEHWDDAKNDFSDSWKYTVEDAAAAGQKYVISPWLDEGLRKDPDALKKFMDAFNKTGELCKKSGMKFGYHNHDFEFNTKVNDQLLFDIILTSTDPSLVAQQLDIGNLYNGGAIAAEVVKKYPGRFELMHVKDEIKATAGNEHYESTILGKGIVGTKAVIEEGRKSGGTTHFIIEQESYQGKSAMDCAKEDLEIMKSWGF